MSDYFQYPRIDPTTFDLIIVGTGLPCSILAAATSNAGKSVLHVDSNSFYGSHFSSLHFDELCSFIKSQQSSSSPLSEPPSSEEYNIISINTRSIYSDMEISSFPHEYLQSSRNFNIDLAGPRVLLSADSMVDVIRNSGACKYIEFKSIGSSVVCDGGGCFWNVPDSRAAIFKDKSLALTEKNQLMRVFKLIQEHLASKESGNGAISSISEEDLQSPFVEFLEKMRLPEKIKLVLLYGIAMADYDQDCMQTCEDRMKTREGINRLALYNSSVGKFKNTHGAFIYPMYGHGELPQAFCRLAAVKGSLYVLRMPVTCLLLDKVSGRCKGVKLASGQDLTCENLVLDPSLEARSLPETVSQHSSGVKVARAICISTSSIKPGSPTFLSVFPPKSLFPEQVAAVRALQLDSDLGISPPGIFVLYLSTICRDAATGRRVLNGAMSALFTTSGVPGDALSKPAIIWSAFYIQNSGTVINDGPVYYTGLPDGNLNYGAIMLETEKLFRRIFPDEEFFRGIGIENIEDDEVDTVGPP